MFVSETFWYIFMNTSIEIHLLEMESKERISEVSENMNQ